MVDKWTRVKHMTRLPPRVELNQISSVFCFLNFLKISVQEEQLQNKIVQVDATNFSGHSPELCSGVIALPAHFVCSRFYVFCSHKCNDKEERQSITALIASADIYLGKFSDGFPIKYEHWQFAVAARANDP